MHSSPRLFLRFLPAGALLLAVGAAGSCSDTSGWVAPECREDADCPGENVCHLFACVTRDSLDGGPVAPDAGDADAGELDAGETDAGGTDAGTDAGDTDAGSDAGDIDAGSDAGPTVIDPVDAGPLTELAPPGATTLGGPVDGIECLTNEQLAFHIHAHLQVYVNGVQKLIPSHIGIGDLDGGAECFSFLHTHDLTGVIHIESPTVRVYTLGNLFHVWGETLSPTQVGPATGTVMAYLNGALYTGDLQNLPLEAHNLVQLDVGMPLVSPQPFTFPSGL